MVGSALKEKEWSGVRKQLLSTGLSEPKVDLILQWLNGEVPSLNIDIKEAGAKWWKIDGIIRQEMKARGMTSKADLMLIEEKRIYYNKGPKKGKVKDVRLIAEWPFPVQRAGLLPYEDRVKAESYKEEMTAYNFSPEIRYLVSDFLVGTFSFFAISVNDKQSAYMLENYLHKKGILTTKIEEEKTKEGTEYVISAVKYKGPEEEEFMGRPPAEKRKLFMQRHKESYGDLYGDVLEMHKGNMEDVVAELEEKSENFYKTADSVDKKMYGDKVPLFGSKVFYRDPKTKDIDVYAEQVGWASPYEIFLHGTFGDHVGAMYMTYMFRMANIPKGSGKMIGFVDDVIFGKEGDLATLDLSKKAPSFEDTDVAAMAAVMYTLYGGAGHEAQAAGKDWFDMVGENAQIARKKGKGKKDYHTKYASDAYKYVSKWYDKKKRQDFIDTLPLDAKAGFEYWTGEMGAYLWAHYVQKHGEPKTEEESAKIFNACKEAAEIIILGEMQAEIGNPAKWFTQIVLTPGTFTFGDKKVTYKEETKIVAGHNILVGNVKGHGDGAYVVMPTPDSYGSNQVVVIGKIVKAKKSKENPTGYKIKLFKDKKGDIKPVLHTVSGKDSLGWSGLAPKWTTAKEPGTEARDYGSYPLMRFYQKSTWDIYKDEVKEEPVPLSYSLDAEVTQPGYFWPERYNEGQLVLNDIKLAGKPVTLESFLDNPSTKVDFVLARQPAEGVDEYYLLVTPELEKANPGAYDLEPKKNPKFVKQTARLAGNNIYMYKDLKTGKWVDAQYGYKHKGDANIEEYYAGTYEVDHEKGIVRVFATKDYEPLLVSHLSGEGIKNRPDTKLDKVDGTITVELPASSQCAAVVKDENVILSVKVYPPTITVTKEMKPKKVKVGQVTTTKVLKGNGFVNPVHKYKFEED